MGGRLSPDVDVTCAAGDRGQCVHGIRRAASVFIALPAVCHPRLESQMGCSEMSARCLFTSAPLPGHLDWGGYLLTAAELARRGHEALWVSEPRIAPHVERAGVPFRAVECIGWRLQAALSQQELSELTAEERSVLRFRRALDAWLHGRLGRARHA